MDVRVIRSWDGLPVGEIVSLDDKQAYSAVLQGRAEYVQTSEEFHELRVLKQHQGIAPGAIIQRTRGVGSVLVTLGVAEWIESTPAPPATETEPELQSLSAKELKAIATQRGIEFKPNASKEVMLQLLTPEPAPPATETEPPDSEPKEGDAEQGPDSEG